MAKEVEEENGQDESDLQDKVFDVVVVGSGQAGLATVWCLIDQISRAKEKRAGSLADKERVTVALVDDQKEATGSWPNYYDSLELFSSDFLSELPGLRFSDFEKFRETGVEDFASIVDCEEDLKTLWTSGSPDDFVSWLRQLNNQRTSSLESPQGLRYPTRDLFVEYMKCYHRLLEFLVQSHNSNVSSGSSSLPSIHFLNIRPFHVNQIKENSVDPITYLIQAHNVLDREKDLSFQARHIVLCTGLFSTPRLPNIPRDTERVEGFVSAGTVLAEKGGIKKVIELHSSQYKSPKPFVGKKVAVIGQGNSGAQIVAELIRNNIESVWVASRSPSLFHPDIDTTLLFLSSMAKKKKILATDPLSAANLKFRFESVINVPLISHTIRQDLFPRPYPPISSIHDGSIHWTISPSDSQPSHSDKTISMKNLDHKHSTSSSSTDSSEIVKDIESAAYEVDFLREDLKKVRYEDRKETTYQVVETSLGTNSIVIPLQTPPAEGMMEIDVVIWSTGFTPSVKFLDEEIVSRSSAFIQFFVNPQKYSRPSHDRPDCFRLSDQDNIWCVGLGDWCDFASGSVIGCRWNAHTVSRLILS